MYIFVLDPASLGYVVLMEPTKTLLHHIRAVEEIHTLTKWRRMVLQMHFNGVNLRNLPPEFADLRLNNKFPCHTTCRDWIRIFHEAGDICPKRATGNRYAEREISGLVLEWLALYRAVLPKATLAKCRAFLFHMDPAQPPYSNSQVHRAEQLLDLKRKAASTTANFATLPSNMLKRKLYWTMPPPLGMVGVAVTDIIDINKAGFFLESSNRNYGKTVSCLRCSQNGVYGRGEKVNLLLAISGDDVNRMRWHEQWREGGTTIERFHTFLSVYLTTWISIFQTVHLFLLWTTSPHIRIL